MARILITGGAGFIGAAVAEAAASAGHDVHLLDNFDRGRRDRVIEVLAARANVHLHVADLREPSSLRELPDVFTHVFHFAGRLGVEYVLAQPYGTLRDNFSMLEAAIGLAARQRDLRRFVFTSTSEVYAGSLLYMGLPLPTPEDTPLALPPLGHPRTSYMLSKVYGEAMVLHSKLPFTVLRPHNIYGPRMGHEHVIPQLLEKAYRAADNTAIEVFSTGHRRTFCFIEDAVRIIMAAAMAESCVNQVLNLGTQSPEISMQDLAQIVIATVGKRLAIQPGADTPGSPERRCPDMSRTRRLTGVDPEVSLDDGIRRTWKWYRDEVFTVAPALA